MKYKNILLGLGSFATSIISIPTIIACNEKNINSLDALNAFNILVKNSLIHNSFTISGVAEKAIIVLKKRINVPKQIQIFYAKVKSNSSAPLISNYKTTSPTNLANKDIWIKFAIKSRFQSTHKLPISLYNPIMIKVTNSFKIIIHAEQRSIENIITFLGTKGKGTIKIKEDANLSDEIQISYAKQQNGNYSKIIPTNLSNGDIIYIKFDIKIEFQKTHKFPTLDDYNPIKMIVNLLEKKLK